MTLIYHLPGHRSKYKTLMSNEESLHVYTIPGELAYASTLMCGDVVQPCGLVLVDTQLSH